MTVRARQSTPAGLASALGAIDLHASAPESLDAFIRIFASVRPKPGELKLADFAGIDRGLVIRWTPTFAQLTPHGGVAVVTELMQKLGDLGAKIVCEIDPSQAYPEARSAIDARALSALSRSASPLAVDLLLVQHERWGLGVRSADDEHTQRDVRLMRLIEPALVVVMGEPNVGKSTLLNTLAGRDLALVAGEAGTTRDHVGALLDLGGLVVRWVDTPGVREAPGPEGEAIELAQRLAPDADLLIAVGDRTTGDPRTIVGHSPGLVVALRADLGRPGWAHDCEVSAETGDGIGDLLGLVRERLVPRADLESVEPWKFWEA